MSDTQTALTLYDTACRAVAEAKTIDEAKEIRDRAVAMATYARQAKNRDLEADAVEIRLRAMRRLDQLRQAQKAAVGLNKGGGDHRVGKKPGALPTLAEAGINKNLAHEGRKLGALSEPEFEQTVIEAREAVTSAVGKVVKSIVVDHRTNHAEGNREFILCETYDGELVRYPKPKNPPQLIRQTNKAISWAAFSTNPITGCLHDCIEYCYARAEATTNPNLKKAGRRGLRASIHRFSITPMKCVSRSRPAALSASPKARRMSTIFAACLCVRPATRMARMNRVKRRNGRRHTVNNFAAPISSSSTTTIPPVTPMPTRSASYRWASPSACVVSI
jgi:hypothetical protein